MKIFISILLGFFLIVFNSCYILDQRTSSLVIQFGEVKEQEVEPGLKFRVPFLQKVIFFDKRVQDLIFTPDDSSNEVVAADQKTMRLDAFAMYQIIDPRKFYETVLNEQTFRIKMKSMIESVIREVVGSYAFIDVLGSKRIDMMKRITLLVNEQAKYFGVKILDVRIKRLDLPDKTRSAVYDRMRTDREKEARQIRSNGSEEAKIIVAKAERERSVLIAEAQKQSEIIRGEGDAESIRVFASAAKRDPEFFEYYRTLEAYKKSMTGKNTKFVIGSDSEFLKYFGKKQ